MLLILVIGEPLFVTLNSFLLLCFCLPTIGLQESIDFEKEILPIFRQHCFECHGEGNTEGELSVESIALLRRGGHTGAPILSSQLGDSELYLRITSLSRGYRMPKKGDSLPPGDVEKIGQWILQVSANLPDESLQARGTQDEPSQSARTSAGRKGGNNSQPAGSVEGIQPAQMMTFVIVAIVFLLLIVWFFYKIVSRPGRREYSGNTKQLKAFMAMVIGVLTSIAFIGSGYFLWRTGELSKENAALRTELRARDSVIAPTIEINEDSLPLPPHPLHPPRLGGKYYRGNDERDPLLFNSGFYRTATIDLNLVNSAGNRVEWESDTNGDLSVEIRIQRAPNATKELFSPRVHKAVELQHYCQTVPASNRNMKFEIVEAEELWTVKVPLPKADQWQDDRVEGMIYMMYGVQPGVTRAPRPHFGIRYDVRVREGAISKESELWMGSLYTLGNRVLIPDENKILLDRWFDWRPIPIIEGEPVTDPELLGIEEHLGDE